jgi:hypothetical protein
MTTATRRDAAGYVLVKCGSQWRQQHRLVVEAQLGRRLKRSEVVHHISERKDDNRPENLIVFASPEGHRRYHDGKTAKIVWDGRRLAGARKAPTGKATGPAVRMRVLRTAPVRWRECEWFQDDLVAIAPADLARLKKNIRENGILGGFTLWEEKTPKGKRRWILDGHQRKLALSELESEGLQLPDTVPGTFVDCRNRSEAAAVVLLLRSTYGKTDDDRLLEFVEKNDLDMAALGDSLKLDNVDLADVAARLDGPEALQKALEDAVKDTRPAKLATRIVIEDSKLLPLAVAALNELRIRHAVEGGDGEEAPC